jgi:hypothetical protein
MPITTEPIAVGTFDKMWISNVMLINRGSGILRLVFNPYDGKNMLATNATIKNYTNLQKILDENAELGSIIKSLYQECKRQAKVDNHISSITVSAPSPEGKVFAIISFSNEKDGKQIKNYTISDCFALAQKDQVFGAAFFNTLAAFAKLAGFTYLQ